MPTHSDQKHLRFFRPALEQLEDRHLLAALPLAAAPEASYASAVEIIAADDPFAANPLPCSESGEFQTDTYYNVKKYGNRVDSKLCWAASAANIFAYTNWGFATSVSGSEPETTLFSTEKEIYDYFVENFTNVGSTLNYAFSWFIEGATPPSSTYAQLIGDGGALYPGISTSNYSSSFAYSAYKGNILRVGLPLLEEGYGICASIGWFSSSAPKNRSGGHALTVWGYTYDDNLDPSDPNYYTGLIITDSDNATKTTMLIPIEWNEQYSMYHLTHFFYTKGWIERLTCIKPVETLQGVSAVGYDGYYDGCSHSITVNGLKELGTKNYTVYYTYEGNTTQYSPSFAQAGNYSVTVVVVQKNGSSVWSAPVEINICGSDGGKLPAPSITEAYSIGNSTYQVSWSEMSGADCYEVAWSSDEGESWSFLITSQTETQLQGLDYSKTYLCRVRAMGDEEITQTSNWSGKMTLSPNPVDLDGDGFIGPGDYALLSTTWFAFDGSENWDPCYDIDGDGFIGPGDFTYLSANWLKTTDKSDFRYPVS